MSTTIGGGKDYLTCAETAKLVRGALKSAFPGVKFAVRSSTYSGGASIRVGWTDGPTSYDVDRIVAPFKGADFDGMVDLKTHNTSWLTPDGTAAVAHSGGGGSTIPDRYGDAPNGTARLVSFGADFIFSERKISDEWAQEIFALFTEKVGRTVGGDPDAWATWDLLVPLAVERKYDGTPGELYRMVDTETERLSTVFHQYTAGRSHA
jgi:hypothetical protein